MGMNVKNVPWLNRLKMALPVAALVLMGVMFFAKAVVAGNIPNWTWLKDYDIPGVTGDKKVALEKEKADRLTAIQTTKQADKQSMVPPAPDHPHVTTEIGPYKGFGPFPSGVFDFNNVGSFAVGDVKFGIYAGALKDTSNQGVIVVSSVDFRGGKDGVETFKSPIASGSLTLKSINGSRVEFTDSSGATGQFDVISRTFTK
jgi:hypothetical protein